jgi:sarcosine dehydrogenase
MDEYKRLAEVGRYYGIPSEVLSPSETAQVHPLMRTDDIYGSIYSPTDGTIDPNNIVMAYAKAAKQLGGKVFEGTGVAGISTESYQTAGGV